MLGDQVQWRFEEQIYIVRQSKGCWDNLLVDEKLFNILQSNKLQYLGDAWGYLFHQMET